jgi:hypothetical protein
MQAVEGEGLVYWWQGWDSDSGRSGHVWVETGNQSHFFIFYLCRIGAQTLTVMALESNLANGGSARWW